MKGNLNRNLNYNYFKIRSDNFAAFRNKRVFIFEITHIAIAIFFIVYHITVMLILDSQNSLTESARYASSNIAWTFTQFTWWTNIGITILQIVRIFLRNTHLNNHFMSFFFGKSWYINWTSYIMLVGILFFTGTLYVIFVPTHLDSNALPNTNTKVQIDYALATSNIIITTFVHLVNPLTYVLFFIFLIKAGYLTFSLSELTWIKLFKSTFLALIYPLFYMCFYIFFALVYYDPYPVSALKSNKGWWIVATGPFIFLATIFSFWTIVRLTSIRRSQTMLGSVKYYAENLSYNSRNGKTKKRK